MNNFFENRTLENLRTSLENMGGHALLNNVLIITRPKIGFGLDKLSWNEVFKILKDNFTDPGSLIQIITRNERGCEKANKPTQSDIHMDNSLRE